MPLTESVGVYRLFAEHVITELLEPVRHRHVVLTVWSQMWWPGWIGNSLFPSVVELLRLTDSFERTWNDCGVSSG